MSVFIQLIAMLIHPDFILLIKMCLNGSFILDIDQIRSKQCINFPMIRITVSCEKNQVHVEFVGWKRHKFLN